MTTTFYEHWPDVPDGAWRWPNFSPAEIACRGTGKLLVNEAALDRLQALRDALGKPLIVRSAYRSPEHNRAVGGAKNSKHMEGIAFDIAMSNHDPAVFEAAARAAGFLGFGFYPRSDFMHIDLGPKREWGERFAPRPAFARETAPASERLAESRTIKGGGVAGLATVGAAGVEVAQEVLAETQNTVLPLVPYLDSLRWVFIGAALAGIAVTIHARIDDWQRDRRRSPPWPPGSSPGHAHGRRSAGAPSRSPPFVPALPPARRLNARNGALSRRGATPDARGGGWLASRCDSWPACQSTFELARANLTPVRALHEAHQLQRHRDGQDHPDRRDNHRSGDHRVLLADLLRAAVGSGVQIVGGLG